MRFEGNVPGQGYVAVFITEHGPTVFPTYRHEQRHPAHAVSVLKDEAVPVALGIVDDAALTAVGEAGKVVFQNDFFLVGTGNLIGSVADLSTGLVAGPGDHQQVILALVLDDLTAFQQAVLLGIPFKQHRIYTTRFDIREVALQFPELTGAVKHVYASVVVKKQGGIVKMLGAGNQFPSSIFGVLGPVDEGTKRLIVGGKQHVEITIVETDGGSPLAPAVDRTIKQLIFVVIGDAVEYIAGDTPVNQVFGCHDGSAWHQMHGGADQVIVLPAAGDGHVGHVGPHYGIDAGGCGR
ncbi:MAG: hypothetical protein BWY72_02289 [Bacteroidetes bacterium ADurb.Bin416]|nr:MAG: hypothetical protein BWY72_02289 [Bacteroidetes bacterium ADurb.Bin416]